MLTKYYLFNTFCISSWKKLNIIFYYIIDYVAGVEEEGKEKKTVCKALEREG